VRDGGRGVRQTQRRRGAQDQWRPARRDELRVPEVSAKLKDPNTKDKEFEDVVKEAEQAAVLVLVY